MLKKLIVGLMALPVLCLNSFAQSTAYVSLPADFSGNAILTVTTAATVILGALAVMWAIRKMIKTTNRS